MRRLAGVSGLRVAAVDRQDRPIAATLVRLLPLAAIGQVVDADGPQERAEPAAVGVGLGEQALLQHPGEEVLGQVLRPVGRMAPVPDVGVDRVPVGPQSVPSDSRALTASGLPAETTRLQSVVGNRRRAAWESGACDMSDASAGEPASIPREPHACGTMIRESPLSDQGKSNCDPRGRLRARERMTRRLCISIRRRGGDRRTIPKSIATIPPRGIPPQGAGQISPRQRPGSADVRPTGSPEGASRGHGGVSPLQGSGLTIRTEPRALPWADLCLPPSGRCWNGRFRCDSVTIPAGIPRATSGGTAPAAGRRADRRGSPRRPRRCTGPGRRRVRRMRRRG